MHWVIRQAWAVPVVAALALALTACGSAVGSSSSSTVVPPPQPQSHIPAQDAEGYPSPPVGYLINKVPYTESCLDLGSVNAGTRDAMLGGTPRTIEWDWNQNDQLGPSCIASTTINKGSSVTLVVAHGQKALNLVPMETGSNLANSAPGAQITATDASGFSAYVAIGQRTVLWLIVSVPHGADPTAYQKAAAGALSALYKTVTGP